MGVFSLRRSLRLALMATLFAAGSAQASVCWSLGDVVAPCALPNFEVIEILPPSVAANPIWNGLPQFAIEKRDDRQIWHAFGKGIEHRLRNWTRDDALAFVNQWSRHHDRDFDEFRRHWHHDHDDHCHDDDDVPRPVPLPGTALLFGPALLMLRAVQRRNA